MKRSNNATLVVGATGMLGGLICRRLRQKRVAVRGLVRPGSPKESALAERGVEIVHGDLKEPASLAAACRGVDEVISTATSIISWRAGDSLKRVDRDGQLALIEAARRAGVRRFLFVSAAMPPEIACPFLDYKRQVEAALKSSGIPWIILKPTAFMETSFSPVLGWDLAAGKAHVFGTGTNLINFISREDVATLAVSALEHSDAENQELLLGGPESLSPLHVVRILEEMTGRSFKVSRTPVWQLQLMRRLLRPFNPRLSSLVTLGLTTAGGGIIEMESVLAKHSFPLTTVRDFARRSLGRSEDDLST